MSLVIAAAAGAAAGWAARAWSARRRERLLGKMLSFAAHEINSPLASLKLTSAGFLQGLYGPVSAEHRPWLAMIREQTARVEALVGDLRDFLHLEFHKDLAIHPEEVDFRELLEEALEATSTSFGRADTPVAASLPASLPELHGDPERLRRVVLAVLAHAKKFRDKGPVSVTARAAGGGVELEVAFRSLAIPEDARGEMLDLYQPAAARDGRGTTCVGFGLGFAALLARMHGGSLGFSLQADGACRINLALPAKGAA